MGRELRFVGYGLALASIALLIVIQFVPTHDFSEEFGGATVEVEAYPWGLESRAGGGIAGGQSEDSKDWFEYSEDVKDNDGDEEGLGELQAQMVLGYIGLGIGALGLLYAMFVSDRKGSLAMMFGGVLVMVALILLSVGIDAHFDDGNGGTSLDKAAGFGMYIAAVCTMIVGGAAVNRA